MSLPIDRTAKTALDANLVNGVTSDAPKLKANNDVIYNTIDELYNYAAGLVQSDKLSEMGIINVKDYGAKGDWNGSTGTDDTAAIQAAIDAAYTAGGGVVYIPKGKYKITTSIIKKANVSILGAGMRVSELVFTTTTGGTIIDTSNQDLRGTFIKGLKFSKASTVTGNVTGILGGSTLANYNSAIGRFEDLFFSGIKYGIRGNAVPTGVGIFDSTFINVWADSCFYGLWLFGSQNTIINPRITTNDTGIAFDYLNGESSDGATITGGLFASNNYDIGFLSASGARPIRFYGTWFEQSVYGIVNIPNANTKLSDVLFSGCRLNTNSTTLDMMDFSKAQGNIIIDGGDIIQTVSGGKTNIVAPSNSNGKLITKDILVVDVSGNRSQLNNQLHVIGNRFTAIQFGSVTATLTGGGVTDTVSVTFPTPFKTGTIPTVFATSGGAIQVTITTGNTNNTGFSFFVTKLTPGSASVTLKWLAVGDE